MPSRHYGPRQLFPTNATSTIYREYDRHPKLTGYRLLLISLTLAFGISKAITSYQGLSFAPTTLEWIFGVVVGIAMYWLGFYENESSFPIDWLFKKDYSAAVILVVRILYFLVILTIVALPVVVAILAAPACFIVYSSVWVDKLLPDATKFVLFLKMSGWLICIVVFSVAWGRILAITIFPVVGMILRSIDL